LNLTLWSGICGAATFGRIAGFHAAAPLNFLGSPVHAMAAA
jgi:hypothetical protein